MCTAITYRNGDFYFGRTLDYEHSFGEEIVITPRNFPLDFRQSGTLSRHNSIIGIARVENGFPLYFDAVNEKGLAMAGLNFTGNAKYEKPTQRPGDIAQYALLPWILSQCDNVSQARTLLTQIRITDQAFRPQLPTAQLHWILADSRQTLTVEAVEQGLQIYDNPVGVLTNNPPFAQQMLNLSNYMQLSPAPAVNRWSPALPLPSYSRGMGGFGLPGDLSSVSRFVRAAFTKHHSVADSEPEACVRQVFHILGSVSQSRGCCRLDQDVYEITQYTACCNANRGIYYYTTYENARITAVDMHRENLLSSELICYPLIRRPQILLQNSR